MPRGVRNSTTTPKTTKKLKTTITKGAKARRGGKPLMAAEEIPSIALSQLRSSINGGAAIPAEPAYPVLNAATRFVVFSGDATEPDGDGDPICVCSSFEEAAREATRVLNEDYTNDDGTTMWIMQSVGTVAFPETRDVVIRRSAPATSPL
jgi:hypothetical protein